MKTSLGSQNWKRQYEVVSELLNNSQQEVNELYQVKPSSNVPRDGRRADALPSQYFNEELDGMFDAANLPDDDAWAAMSKKVKDAQQGKARVEYENSYVASVFIFPASLADLLTRQLKTRIAELEIQHEQYVCIDSC